MSESSTRPSGHGSPSSSGPDGGDPLLGLRGVGPARRQLLARLGIDSLSDALLHLPSRYEDRRFVSSLPEVREGNPAAIQGSVVSVRTHRRGGGKAVFEVEVDIRGEVLKARWFHARGMERSPRFKPGVSLALYGSVTRAGGRAVMLHPDVEVSDGTPSIHFGRVVPVYPSVEGLSQRVLRGIMAEAVTAALGDTREVLAQEMSARLGFPSRREALETLHRPPGEIGTEELQSLHSRWRERLAFEELLLLQLGLKRRRNIEKAAKKPLPAREEGPLVPALLSGLGFDLTKAQKRVYGEIAADMASPFPMRRLLQGDVGAGKTVIAALAVCRAVAAGAQAALMVPTEVLSQQHGSVFMEMLAPLGIRTAVLSSGHGEQHLSRVRAELAAGKVDVAVGTHALIQESVRFQRLGLAVIDEQHRFGVRQRLALRKKGTRPDLLAMTATPIPRTLCLACYSDFDLSVLDELPPGRRTVVTEVWEEERRADLSAFMSRELGSGHRVFVVLPAVEDEGRSGLRTVTATARQLRQHVSPEFEVALVHGRMDHGERRRVMERFRNGTAPLLVATTVVEVGVDVPEATLLVVEQAERFGLSQLHQLRGRVGRSDRQAHCVLMVSPGAGEEARHRLEIIAAEHDGFRIAEADLALRGPGDVLGTRQAGMPPLRVADLAAHRGLLAMARQEAENLLAADPELSSSRFEGLRGAVNAMWRGKFHLAAAG